MSPLIGPYAITPDHTLENWLDVIDKSKSYLDAGGRVIQYRNKITESVPKPDHINQLRELTAQYNGTFIINDDLELAVQLGADGLHLGGQDMPLVSARKAFPDGIIGISCYNLLENARIAQQSGADYVAFGRFFPSNTKPDAILANPELLAQAKQEIRLPLIAIGGITLANARELIEAGADSVAVIDGLFSAEDISATTRQFMAMF